MIARLIALDGSFKIANYNTLPSQRHKQSTGDDGVAAREKLVRFVMWIMRRKEAALVHRTGRVPDVHAPVFAAANDKTAIMSKVGPNLGPVVFMALVLAQEREVRHFV